MTKLMKIDIPNFEQGTYYRRLVLTLYEHFKFTSLELYSFVVWSWLRPQPDSPLQRHIILSRLTPFLPRSFHPTKLPCRNTFEERELSCCPYSHTKVHNALCQYISCLRDMGEEKVSTFFCKL